MPGAVGESRYARAISGRAARRRIAVRDSGAETVTYSLSIPLIQLFSRRRDCRIDFQRTRLADRVLQISSEVLVAGINAESSRAPNAIGVKRLWIVKQRQLGHDC